MSPLAFALPFALAFALMLGWLFGVGRGTDEYPCAVAWTATDAEYEAHVACDLAQSGR